MGGLYKKEVLIKPSSTMEMDEVIPKVEGWLNLFYIGALAPEIAESIDDNIEQILDAAMSSSGNSDYDPTKFGDSQYDDFFAEIYDARNGSKVRIYHSACAISKGMQQLVFHEAAPMSQEAMQDYVNEQVKLALDAATKNQIADIEAATYESIEIKKTLTTATPDISREATIIHFRKST